MDREANGYTMREVASEAIGRAAVAADARLVELLDQHEHQLFAFLVVLLADREGAADCLQDTFLRAYEHLCKDRPVTLQWLYTVARNRAVDELRRRKRLQVEVAPLDSISDEERSTWAGTAAVREALLRLSPDDREVLYLAEVDGFTSIEIGAMLGIRPGTVRMRLSRAHLRFRAAFGEGR